MSSLLLSLLSAPLYQTQWNGISLAEVAVALGRPVKALADRDFYTEFYKRLSQRNFSVGTEWLSDKQRFSARVRAMFDKVDPHWREHGRVALAAGAGLGIVEIPLIVAGYRIHLQDCQTESLRYFEMHSTVPAERTIVASTLVNLPSASYDAVYFSQVVYAMDVVNYRSALHDVRRILKPGGTLAIWEPECRWRHILRQLKPLPQAGVFWGWTRSRLLHEQLAREAGFRPMWHAAVGSDQQVVPEVSEFLGCALRSTPPHLQELVFTKTD